LDGKLEDMEKIAEKMRVVRQQQMFQQQKALHEKLGLKPPPIPPGLSIPNNGHPSMAVANSKPSSAVDARQKKKQEQLEVIKEGKKIFPKPTFI